MNFRGLAILASLALAVGLLNSCSGAAPTSPANGTIHYAIVSGDGQTGGAGLPLSQQLVVSATDEGGKAVSGKSVNFTVTAGGGQLSLAQAVTDVAGRAKVTWTLGSTAGSPQTAEAHAASDGHLIGQFSATVTAGPPASITALQGDSQSVTAGLPVALALKVKVADQFGNPVTGRGVTLQVTAGGGSLTGSSATTDAAGTATLAGWTLGDSAGTNTCTATVAGTPLTRKFTATGLRPVLALSTPPSSTAQSGVPLAQQPVVQVTDGQGNSVPLRSRLVTAFITGGSDSVLGTSTVATDSTGRATFTDLAVAGSVGSPTLGFSSSGMQSVTPLPIALSAGPAAVVNVYEGNNQTTVAGFPVSIPPAVQLTDQQGNPIPGQGVTFAVTLGGGSITGASQTTDAQGIARVGSWMLGPNNGTNQLTATVADPGIAGNPVTFTATAAPPVLGLATPPPSWTLSGATLSPQPVIQIQDETGSSIALSGKVVTVSLTSGSGSLGGTTTATTDATGKAVWTDLALTGPVGPYTLSFSATGMQTITAAISITTGPPTTLALNGGSGQSAQAGTTLPVAPSVKVTDANGNPVGGVPVSFQVTTGGGSVTGGSATTDGTGVATVGSWTLGPQSGTNTLTVTSTDPGLGGQQVLISATATGNFWRSLAGEPVGLLYSASGISNGLLYVAGGKDSTLAIRPLLEVYDPATNTWATRATMPTARAAGAGGFLNGVFYLSGGVLSDSTGSNAMEAYNPQTNTWTAGLAPQPFVGGYSASAVLNGKLYVAGGGAPTGAQESGLEVYDPATDSWSSKAPLPASRKYASGVVLNGKLYVVGGLQGTLLDGALLVYDPQTDSWSSGASMPTPRYLANAAAINGKIYVAGGLLSVSSNTPVVEVYDPTTDSWSTVAPMPMGRDGSATAAINGLLYVAGGKPTDNITGRTSVYVP